jgi:predicted membrane protein
MGFLFSGVFWGIVLILLGFSVIINLVFHIHLPLFRIFFALFLIYLGLRIMAGGGFYHHPSCGNRGSTIAFSDATIASDAGDGEFNIIFAKGVVEAGSIFSADPHRRSLRITTVFGNTLVRTPKNLPVIIRTTSAFGGITLPDGSTSAFGETIYKNDSCRSATDSSTARTILINVVFGACRIEER